MTKREFLSELRMRLSGLPAKDAEEHLDYYCEMIDDRIEEGLSEEDAVAAVGTVSDVAAQILAEEPIEEEPIEGEVPKKRKARRKMRGWEITLLVLGSPIWLSLLIAAAAVVFSLWISAWAVVISLWSGFAGLVGGAISGLVSGVGSLTMGHGTQGIALIAAGLVVAGLSIFAFFGCRAATLGMASATQRTVIGIRKYFVKREESYE